VRHARKGKKSSWRWISRHKSEWRQHRNGQIAKKNSWPHQIDASHTARTASNTQTPTLQSEKHGVSRCQSEGNHSTTTWRSPYTKPAPVILHCLVCDVTTNKLLIQSFKSLQSHRHKPLQKSTVSTSMIQVEFEEWQARFLVWGNVPVLSNRDMHYPCQTIPWLSAIQGQFSTHRGGKATNASRSKGRNGQREQRQEHDRTKGGD